MRPEMAATYRSPRSREPLTLLVDLQDGPEVTRGTLVTASGEKYAVNDGIPYLVVDDDVHGELERHGLSYYEQVASDYDRGQDWLFSSFAVDEAALRRLFVETVDPAPSDRILEIGCGTGRDSVHLARALGPGGHLALQDLSPEMLKVGRHRLQESQTESGPFRCTVDYFCGSVADLPFDDAYFDACFHFGAVNTFTDQQRAIGEMTRVTRIGGRVVLGDEGLAPWLRQSTYGKILFNSNPLYRHSPPLAQLPESARGVRIRWLIGNAFYLIDYTVGGGAPTLDLDLPIPGRRGGTHRSRYYGRLEGVTEDVRAMVEAAAEAAGESVHGWLDRSLRSAARSGRPDA